MEPDLMAGKTKLELTWIGKDIRPRLEPRILIEEPEFSHHAATRKDGDIFDNMLIHGDNLLALKALETDPAVCGQVKCVFIDPPYNTGSAFEHYDDGLEHSLWLGMMRDRLEILRNLLTDDGSIWITIDDNEAHYLKVLCDEVFGRKNFVATIIWEKRKSRENRRAFSFKHDHMLVYALSKPVFEAQRNPLAINAAVLERYKNPDDDPRGPWQSVAITAQAGHGVASQFYTIVTPSGRSIDPPTGNCWRFTQRKLDELIADGRIYFGATGGNVPRQKKFLSESEDAGLTPETIWYADDVSTNDLAKRHCNELFGSESFDTPKPEELLQRVIHIATNPGDLVLDSFAGSGTTGAVAHKMGRRWIMVELGDHAKTHIVPRMHKVIAGTDRGGVTGATGWTGGGGYRFVKMAPSLLEKDAWGNWVIAKGYNPAMLAEAICKNFGFTYAPSTEHYWMHGFSSETSYIYVTTASLTNVQLRALSDEVGPGRSLLICCTAYEGDHLGDLTNLTIRKIPGSVLDRCEWGKDDYSLKIESLPMMADDDDAPDAAPGAPGAKPKAKDTSGAVADLFTTEGE
jgi:adenine-specific DNA-methyltransferase